MAVQQAHDLADVLRLHLRLIALDIDHHLGLQLAGDLGDAVGPGLVVRAGEPRRDPGELGRSHQRGIIGAHHHRRRAISLGSLAAGMGDERLATLGQQELLWQTGGGSAGGDENGDGCRHDVSKGANVAETLASQCSGFGQWVVQCRATPGATRNAGISPRYRHSGGAARRCAPVTRDGP
jgi:hypothetical protein